MVQTWIKFFKNLKLTFGAVKNLIQGSLAPLSQQITTNHSLSTIRWKCAKEYCVSSPISWVIFSVFDKTMGVFFTRNGIWLIAGGLGFKNKYNWIRIVMTTTNFWPPIRYFASHALKDNLTQLGKTLHISHYKWNVWSLCWENHSITFSFNLEYFGVKQPIFARFVDILSSPGRIVAWSLLQHHTMDSQSP